jgi:hypothetical protein
MDALEELKQLSTDVTTVISQIEAEQTGAEPPVPTDYSSSVTSVVVDPDTGNISLAVTLYPGDNPIVPVPTPEERAAAEVTDTVPPVNLAPGQVPAQ